MFFCEECQRAKGWPQSLARSRGLCEICGKAAVCYDVPSSALPEPEPEVVHQKTHFVVAAVPVTGRGRSADAAEGAASMAAMTRAHALGEVLDGATVARGPSVEEALRGLDYDYLHAAADEDAPPYTALVVPTKLLVRAQRLWDEMGEELADAETLADIDERRMEGLRSGLIKTLHDIVGLKDKETTP